MANKTCRNETRMAKRHGIDTVHEYIKIVKKGFSAIIVYKTALD